MSLLSFILYQLETFSSSAQFRVLLNRCAAGGPGRLSILRQCHRMSPLHHSGASRHLQRSAVGVTAGCERFGHPNTKKLPALMWLMNIGILLEGQGSRLILAIAGKVHSFALPISSGLSVEVHRWCKEYFLSSQHPDNQSQLFFPSFTSLHIVSIVISLPSHAQRRDHFCFLLWGRKCLVQFCFHLELHSHGTNHLPDIYHWSSSLATVHTPCTRNQFALQSSHWIFHLGPEHRYS